MGNAVTLDFIANPAPFKAGVAAADASYRKFATNMDAMQREAANIFQSTRTPLEVFATGLEKADLLLRQGAIDAETYDRQIKKLGADLQASGGGGGGEEGGLRGGLLDLRSSFGKGSTAGMLMKTLMGGGTIMVIGMVTKAFEGLTEKILAMSEGLSSGEMTWQRALTEMGASLPIIGSIAKAFDNLWVSIAGGQTYEQSKKHIEDVKKAAQSLAEMAAESNKRAEYNETGPDETERIKARQKRDDEIEKARKSFEGSDKGIQAQLDFDDVNAQAEIEYQNTLRQISANRAKAQSEAEVAVMRKQLAALEKEAAENAAEDRADVAAIRKQNQPVIDAYTNHEKAIAALTLTEEELIAAKYREVGVSEASAKAMAAEEVAARKLNDEKKRLAADSARSLDDVIAKEKTRRDKLADFGKQVTESVKTPIEKYRDEVGKLQEALNEGVITEDVYSKAIKAAADEAEAASARSAKASLGWGGIESAMSGFARMSSAAATFGSEDPSRKVAQHTGEIAQTEAKALEFHKQTARHQDRVATALEKGFGMTWGL